MKVAAIVLRLGLGALLLSALAGRLAADVIHIRGGTSIAGVLVVEETAREVRYRLANGAVQSVPADSVLLIVRQDAPHAWTLAWRKFIDRQYAETIELLRPLVECEKTAGGWSREYAFALRARAALALGDYAAAVAAVGRLSADYPNSRWTLSVTEVAVVAHRATGHPDLALAAIEARRKIVADKDLPQSVADETDLWIADLTAERGDLRSASDLAGDLCLRAAGDPARRAVAHRAKARLVSFAIAAGAIDRAKEAVRDLEARVAAGDRDAIRGAAIANADLALAEKKGLHDAAWALAAARIEIAPGADAAAARHRLFLLFSAIGERDPKARELAKSYRAELLAQNPLSFEAADARKRDLSR